MRICLKKILSNSAKRVGTSLSGSCVKRAAFMLVLVNFNLQATPDPTLVYRQLMERVQREYVEPVAPDKLLEGSLQGMLESLDPHSTYFTPQKFKEIQNQTMGNYGGVGLEIMMEEGALRVVTAVDDGPAFKAGLQPGDLIIAVNEEPLYGMESYKAAEALRGEPGTVVNITVKRQLAPSFQLSLKRELVKHHPIKSKLLYTEHKEVIGYIRLSTFNELTTKELREAVLQIMHKEKSRLKGFIIDIRNNAGGLFEQAISASSEFVKQGLIVSIKNHDPRKRIDYKAKGKDILNGLPMVVLINAGSASAAEIFAGALQDHNRAIIVGTRSFGKGSVQTIFPLPQGGAIKLTTAYYYTPSGRSIQKAGIVPDIEIKQLIDVKAIDETQRYRESNLKSALNYQGSDKEKKAPLSNEDFSLNASSNKEKKFLSPLEDVKDYQLEQAVNIVKAIDLKNKIPALAPSL